MEASRAWFDELYNSYRGDVRRLTRHYATSREDAEDAEQDTWLTILKNAGRIDPEGNPKNYVTTTSISKTISIKRKKVKRREITGYNDNIFERMAAPNSYNPFLSLTVIEERESETSGLKEAIKRLDPTMRDILVEKDLMGETEREVGSRRGMGQSSVHYRLNKAREQLRKLLAA